MHIISTDVQSSNIVFLCKHVLKLCISPYVVFLSAEIKLRVHLKYRKKFVCEIVLSMLFTDVRRAVANG